MKLDTINSTETQFKESWVNSILKPKLERLSGIVFKIYKQEQNIVYIYSR